MQYSYKIFRIFGISVELHITFLLFFLVVLPVYWVSYGIMSGIGMALLFAILFAIVLLHELMHSITAKLNGISVPRIILLPIGGLASIEIPEKPEIELMVSAAGPLFNFAFAGLSMIILLLVSTDPTTALTTLLTSIGNLDPVNITSVIFNFQGILSLLVWINFMLGLFNILPGFPMDGGRVFRSILAFWMDYTRATRIAVKVGQIIFIFMMILGFLSGDLWILIIGLFLFYAGGNELKVTKIKHALHGVTIGHIAVTDMTHVDESMTIEDFLNQVAKPSQVHYPISNTAGRIIGILNMSDLRSVNKKDFYRIPVKNLARGFEIIDADKKIDAKIADLLTKEFLLVVSGTKLVGYITPDRLIEAARFYGIKIHG